MLGREIARTISALQTEHPAKYRDANLSVKIVLKAPTGWTAITHNGQAIAYHASPEMERAADTAVEAAFQASQDKSQIYADPQAQPYLVAEEDKKQRLTLLVQKYAGSTQLSGQVA